MMQQLAHDFRDESEALFALLARQDIAVLDRPTLFKGWTPCDAISHLHAWNITADPVHVHDMQATILHLLGIDHTRLLFRYQGRQFRLTDVHGHVVKGILA